MTVAIMSETCEACFDSFHRKCASYFVFLTSYEMIEMKTICEDAHAAEPQIKNPGQNLVANLWENIGNKKHLMLRWIHR